MPIWSNTYLNRLILEAEVEIAKHVPCIIDRVSVPTYEFYGLYKLPPYVNNVRRVFWKGIRLIAVPYQAWDDYFYSDHNEYDGAFQDNAFQFNAFQVGSASTNPGKNLGPPTGYMYSNFNENYIRLLPGVNESLLGYSSGLHSTNIDKSLIVEFYRMPDGETWKIPDYIRRRTIKCYVLWKAFLKEGDGQNIKASDYYKGKYQLALGRAKKIIDNIYAAQINTINPRATLTMQPRRPRLPWNWEAVTEDD